MGRARSGQQPTAVRDFETVFGTRRGSTDAQAARDAAEHAGETAALKGVLATFVFAVCARGNYHPSPLADLLVRAYRAGAPEEETATAVLAQLLAGQLALNMPVLGEVEAVLSIGDPDIAPGLTAPVQDALRNLLADNPWEADPPHAKKYAEQIISSLFWKPHVLSYYLRLEPLCATLAVLIGDPEDHGSASLGLAAIRALESAPEGALAGPLKPWIAAFSARIDSGCSFPRHDRELVSRVLAKYAPGSVGSIALAGLQARL